MSYFKTLDLSPYYNHSDKRRSSGKRIVWDSSADERWIDMPKGRIRCQGVPFRLSNGGSARFIALGNGARSIHVPLRGKATHVCILHFCDAITDRRKRVAMGDIFGEYTLSFSDGSQETTMIRKRFEVDCFGQGRGRAAFTTLPYAGLIPTTAEDMSPYGRTQTGVKGAIKTRFLADLYALKISKPELPLAGVTFCWVKGLSLGVLGLTLYRGPGHPLRLQRRNIFRVALPSAEKAVPSDVATDVDLGHITRFMPAPAKPGKGWEAEDGSGLGRASQAKPTSEFHVEAATAVGATLKIKSGKHKAHTFLLDKMYARGRTRSEEGAASIQMLHGERTWVRVKVTDGSTGKPTPTRIHFSGSKGEYLPPQGHHADVNTNWFEDYAGEVKLGETNYAYVPGEFQIELPVGDVYVEFSKGFEYQPSRRRITIRPGQRELELQLSRPIDLRKEGWVTADTHVHFISPQTAWLEGQAEGLNLVNLLASQWGKMYTNVADISGTVAGCSSNDTMVWVGTENRHHMLGHISMLGVKGLPVFPMCNGGPGESFFGDAEYCLLTEWAERCRKQGGAVIRPHFPAPTCEDPTYLINGLADAVEIRNLGHPGQGPYSSGSLAEWYRYLNCGYRISAAGGTDKMSAGTPVGGSRTYARLAPNKRFSFASWTEAVRAGRTFVSNGPLIDLTLSGKAIGDEIRMPKGGGTLEAAATVQSVWPVHVLELIVNGKVVDAIQSSEQGEKVLALKSSLKIGESSWIAARCMSRYEKHQIMMGSGYLGAHTSPIYVRVADSELFSPSDAVYMLTLLEGTVAYLDTLGTRLSEKRHSDMMAIVHAAQHTLMDRLGWNPPHSH